MNAARSLPAPAAELATARSAGTIGARGALALLTLVYLLNFLDRTLIYVLFAPMKAELALSDLQLALLGSTSFVLFYTTLGVPFGRLADRVSRRRLIAAGLATWSLASGLTGFATDFWSIFACRVLVGVGEASLGPAAMSLLSDLFPASRRGTVQSIYSAGVPLGAAVAFFLGGAIGDAWGWRAAFPLLGFPGLVLALVVLRLHEPARAAAGAGPAAPVGEAGAPAGWRDLVRLPALRWHVFGYATLAIAANSLSIWVPSWLVRARGVPLTTVGTMAGVALLVAGGAGTFFGGALADRWQRRSAGGRRRFSATLAALSVPAWLVLLLVPSQPAMFAAYFALAGLGLAWLGPAAADVHDLVGPRLRGLGIAVYFLVVNLVGYGAAPPIVGWLSDRLGGATDPAALGHALVVAPAACAVAAVLLWAGARRSEGATA